MVTFQRYKSSISFRNRSTHLPPGVQQTSQLLIW